MRFLNFFLWFFLWLITFNLLVVNEGFSELSAAPGKKPQFISVQIKDQIFFLEIAATEEARAMGLMFRKELADNGGMLFVFPQEEILSFWMKNTLISLDMIFLNSRREVVKIHHNVPLCREDPCASYDSGVPARYVIELKGGSCKKLNLQTGDLIFFKID